jgi:hypothetical protein
VTFKFEPTKKGPNPEPAQTVALAPARGQINSHIRVIDGSCRSARFDYPIYAPG